MELLETHDPEKKKLIEASSRYKHELQKEVKSITENTEKVITNAVIIGAALALTYFAVSQFTGGKSKKKKAKSKKHENLDSEEKLEAEISRTPTVLSQIGDMIVTQGTLILLDLAKDKLMEYLNQRKQGNEHT